MQTFIHNCPQWANYAARNKDGYWYFYSHKPKPSNKGWACGGLCERIKGKPYKHEDWHASILQLR